jgi:hypothetical protein
MRVIVFHLNALGPQKWYPREVKCQLFLEESSPTTGDYVLECDRNIWWHWGTMEYGPCDPVDVPQEIRTLALLLI